MPESSDAPSEHPSRRRVRRAPKFPQFILVGTVIGLVVGIVAAVQGESGGYSDAATLGLFALIFSGVGALVAAGIAVLLDRRSLR